MTARGEDNMKETRDGENRLVTEGRDGPLGDVVLALMGRCPHGYKGFCSVCDTANEAECDQ